VAFILAAVAIDSKIRSRFPDDDMGKDSLPARKKAQFEAAKQFKIFYQFQFTDQLERVELPSNTMGSTTLPSKMRMGHYDHGSGPRRESNLKNHGAEISQVNQTCGLNALRGWQI
jgi:hypothetical protein